MFPVPELPPALIADLRRQNPWWSGDPAPVQPGPRRHLVGQIRRRLNLELAPIVAVRGPRQVGKTTAQLQLIEDLLTEGAPPNTVLRVQFDDLGSLHDLVDPILRIADWFEHHVAGSHFNRLARAGQWAHLFFDEVQTVRGWHVQLKSLVDNASVRVMITGSSALRIERGRDSLAGRISTIETGVFSLTEIGPLHGLETPEPFLPTNGLSAIVDKAFWADLREHGTRHADFRTTAFRHFSERGGYPVVHRHEHVDWAELADLLYETVIRRVIQHDLLNGNGRRRDASLLEALLHLVSRYAGLAPAVSELAEQVSQSLSVPVDGRRVTRYLNLLADTLLVRLIPPLDIRMRKNRGGPKLCLADHALRACWLQEQVPLAPDALAERPELTTQGRASRRERLRLDGVHGCRARHRALASPRRRSRGGFRPDRRCPPCAGRDQVPAANRSAPRHRRPSFVSREDGEQRLFRRPDHPGRVGRGGRPADRQPAAVDVPAAAVSFRSPTSRARTPPSVHSEALDILPRWHELETHIGLPADLVELPEPLREPRRRSNLAQVYQW